MIHRRDLRIMDESVIKRIPPHNEAAERAVIGAMMMGFALTAGFTKMDLLKLLRR